MANNLILCDCLGSQKLDADGLQAASGMTCSRIHTALCTTQIDLAAKAISAGDCMIACQQERPRFEELAEELGVPAPEYVDLRDRAGWTNDAANTLPKMSALLAEAMLTAPTEKTVDVVSEGMCLIIGFGDIAVRAAADLAETLNVTLLLTDDTEVPPSNAFDIVRGQVKHASGAFAGFTLRLDGLRTLIPGGRGEAQFSEPRNGANTECDIILDLTGGTAMFPAPDKREGYLRADPTHAPSVAAAVFQASHMAGTFEKPLYVRLEPSLCAHSRAEQIGCSNCLNICPTGAITPAGDHVAIDPMVCAGCGSCAALCPSGAITYDAPPTDALMRRINTLASAYRTAGGAEPVLLVHDENHGTEMVALLGRFGDGLPANVIPMAVSALAGFGHAEILAALASGFARVDILTGPKTELDALEREINLAQALSKPEAVRLLGASDPDALSDELATGTAACHADPILPMGSRRQITRLAAKTLHPDATEITLPEGAPYGDVQINTGACTLCLSCVSLCPSGALHDNPDKPQLLFQEDACLQCGLCENICPESAITLSPRLNLTDESLGQVVKNEEEPFACIECGSLFGVKSTVERITEKLAGKHSMFATSDAAKMIQMCDNCRVNAQFHSTDNPFQGKERPKPRTTDDYFSKRKDH